MPHSTRLRTRNTWLIFVATSMMGIGEPAAAASTLSQYPSGVPLTSDLSPNVRSYDVSTGTALYVHPQGSGTLCTDAAPCSLEQGISAANASGNVSVVFQSGVYALPREYEIKKPSVTLQAAPGEVVWLEGSRVVDQWQIQDGRWWTDSSGFELGVRSNIRPEDLTPVAPLAAHREAVFVDDRPLWQVASVAELQAGAFYIDAANHRLWLGDSPLGKTVKIVAVPRAFHFFPAGGHRPDGGRVRGLGFRYFADAGVQMKGNQMVLEGNTLAWIGDVGASLYTDPDGYRHLSTKRFGFGNVVRDNLFVANGRNGLRASRQDDLTIADNYFAYNNVERYRTTWSAGAMKVTSTHSSTITGNTLENNFAVAIWLDVSCHGVQISDNAVQRNSFSGQDVVAGLNLSAYNEGCFGIHAELSHRLDIIDNMLDGNASAALYISESSALRVAGNEMRNSHGNAIRIRDKSRDSQVQDLARPRAAELIAEDQAFGITWNTWGNSLHDNLLHSTSTARRDALVAYDTPVQTGSCPGGTVRVPNEAVSGCGQTSGQTYTNVCSTMALMMCAMNRDHYRLPGPGTLVVWAAKTADRPEERYSDLEALEAAHPGYESEGTVTFGEYP